MSYQFDIEIDSGAGFCFGVKNAVEKAEAVLNANKELFCLGDIVHNDEEVKRLESLGMKTIDHQALVGLKNKTVLIRAHGEPPETYKSLFANQNTLIEATCPVVLKLQERIEKTHQGGDFILIYGKKSHPEIIGITGRLTGNYLVFSHFEELEPERLPSRLCLYSQTTMDVERLHAIADRLRALGKEIVLKDTVCRQVSGRKEALQNFALRKDVVLMVAGIHSSNGRILLEACREVNPQSYLVGSEKDLDSSWFKPGDRVGISGATSTPAWLMDQIADYLRSW